MFASVSERHNGDTPRAPVSLRVMGRSFCSDLRLFDECRTAAIHSPAGGGDGYIVDRPSFS